MPSSLSQAEVLAQAQLDAYNAHDLEPFLACFAEQVQVFVFPSTLQFSGKAAMRERYAQRFTDETLHARLLNRMVQGQTVIDQELVSLRLPEGPGTMEAIAIYDVQDGLIARVTFILGVQRLLAA
ncbi:MULTISPECIES: nuclear transport factor 2 family protein [unclassified Paludibacterium]|uniref:nuclear transport factor 2 family protein n=1 Tax=unclassified Paludibacterium TaxID=2618429 RepID=UPI001C040049|nr:nuclear transport factor 2 family protein [Paludibacterium sp. B53371]BEV73217.1 nuclear transport factor 2 family protein [Paludibacterium sp. THUN1379]